MGRAEISSHSRIDRPLGSPDPRVCPIAPIQAYKPTMATLPPVFRSSFTMRITGFLNAWLLIHFVNGINFPGLRVPLSGPRASIYSLESCTDVSSSGAVLSMKDSGETSSRCDKHNPGGAGSWRGTPVHLSWLRRINGIRKPGEMRLDLCSGHWSNSHLFVLCF